MSEWRSVALGEVADILVGHAFKSAKFATAPEGVRLLRGANVHQGFTDWGQEARWPSAEEYDSRYELREGDVVLAMDRPWIEAGLKRARLRSSDLPALLVQRVARLRGTERSLTSFLHHTLATEQFSRYLQMQVTGATVPHISQTQIASYPMRLPSKREQALICDVLDAFDELIENNRRRVEVLEEIAQAIYREWFVKFRYPGHDAVPLVESALGVIPDGWQETTLGEAARWFSGGTPKTTVAEYWNGDLPWITSGTLTSMLLDRSDRMLTELGAAMGTRIVERDALLFVVRGMSLAKEFRVGIADARLAFGQDVKALVASPGIDPMYLALSVITRAEEIQRMVEFAGHGTGKISTDRLQALHVLRPPVELQRHFADTFRPLREMMTALKLAGDRLVRLRDDLLPKLVTGRIDVPTLDVDGLVLSGSTAGVGVA